ncbi:GerAB/ArcD/ProY family transporter [Paenibacillus thermoaerophilus]|uniref:GerAB/ArcD/ProY family transporter n=1 Tax=Paenibacillus thermoaerophilus TaxID=1215385 RepID=A0ABW2V7J0_9BACL|nr:GerAB/ArcD/ProY family transporter [Paenibacillus thermoaerophilus]TMV12035.1 hypothetical protein FE781_12620 [Paenibacillus thermoaerophilus]
MSKSKLVIGNIQMVMLTGSLLSASNIISLPAAFCQISGRDAWFGIAVPICFTLIVIYAMYKLSERSPGSNLFEIARWACGKWAGGLLNAVLIGYLFVDLVGSVRLFTDHIHSSILLRTPREFTVMIIMVVIVYFGQGTIEDIARTNNILFPQFLLLFLGLPLLLLNEIDYTQIQPVLANGWLNPLLGGVPGIGAFGDIIAMGAFLGCADRPRHMLKALRIGTILAGIVLTEAVWSTITVITARTAASTVFVGWIITQQIHITDFLDRVELFLLPIWMPIVLIRFCVLFQAITTGLASYARECKPYKFANVTGLLVMLAAIVSFRNVTEVMQAMNFGMAGLAVVVQLFYLGALLICVRLRKRESHIAGRRMGEPASALTAAAVGLLLVILAGSLFGRTYQAVGNAAAVVYLILLACLLWLSFRELRRLTARPSANLRKKEAAP